MIGRHTLADHEVLVVEDDWFIASYVSDALQNAGAAVVGPFATAADALRQLEDAHLPRAATLNVRLADGSSEPVARRLDELDVPFLFLSAQGRESLPPDLAARPRLEKPFGGFQVVEAVAALLAAADVSGR